MTDLPNLIGITGRATAGKDSVGHILVEEHGYTRFAFADALKSMALALDPIISFDEDVCDDVQPKRLGDIVTNLGWEVAKTSPEVRRLLQVLGTEGVRDHIGEDAWIRAAGMKMRRAGWPDSRIVLTDVRFPNEAMFVREHGGEMWRVERDVPKLDHASESQVDALRVDFTICNDGPLSALPHLVAVALGVDPLVQRYL